MVRRPGVFVTVIVIAALMGGLGWTLLSGGPVTEGYEARLNVAVMAVILMGASVLLWTTLAALLGPRRPLVWAAVGLVSPLLGGLLVLPPVSFLVIFNAPVICFGVGLTTGLLVWAAFRYGESPKSLKGVDLWNEVV
ncbi:hypothetical protein [Tautonia rosea]|uniref:hypothetical protein n=1 Tax=Tautonia rosea TaxID=2728037 RepID=UPI001472F82B|nr:hypothetical protein [Tautonia rosea]